MLQGGLKKGSGAYRININKLIYSILPSNNHAPGFGKIQGTCPWRSYGWMRDFYAQAGRTHDASSCARPSGLHLEYSAVYQRV